MSKDLRIPHQNWCSGNCWIEEDFFDIKGETYKVSLPFCKTSLSFTGRVSQFIPFIEEIFKYKIIHQNKVIDIINQYSNKLSYDNFTILMTIENNTIPIYESSWTKYYFWRDIIKILIKFKNLRKLFRTYYEYNQSLKEYNKKLKTKIKLDK